MALTALARPRLPVRSHVQARAHPLRLPVSNVLVWAGAFAFYIGFAAFAVFHLHYMINDALTRVDNAFNVLFSRDPHLGAIGFVWPPLPSFLMLPLLAFKGLWPPLATQGFAGSLEAAAFSAGTVVLLNVGLRWAGVVRGMRAVLCLVWMINPMIVIYATQGMSEAEFVFFFFASILVFLRWCDSRRASLLPLAGLLAGCAALCRVEALLIVLVMGYGVVMQSIQNRAGWRQVETLLLLYALPALFMIGLWLVTAAILFHDPLYLLHANGLATSASAPSANAPVASSAAAARSAYGLQQVGSWKDAAVTVGSHILALFPAAVMFVGLLGARLLTQRGRVAGVTLLVLGITIPAIDILLERTGTSPLLRYQIAAIPFAYLIAVYVLRSLRRRPAATSLAALGMAAVFVLSNLVTAQTLANPRLSEEEAPVVTALEKGRPVQPGGDYSALSVASRIDAQLLRLDWDRGLILCDSATCFSLNIAAPDPRLFVVTSDRIFEAAAVDPAAYHVEYFLVPDPQAGAGAIDRLNGLYPNLWRTGGGFATLVGEGPGGGPEANWRLYRITGSTRRLIEIPR